MTSHRRDRLVFDLFDLVAVLGLVGLTVVAVFAPEIRETPIRIPLGFLFVIFLPGYAIVAALFPRSAGESEAVSSDPRSFLQSMELKKLGGFERIALSLGVSLATVGLVALGLAHTPLGIRLEPVVAAISLVTVAAAGAAAWRRLSLDPEERFVLQAPVGSFLAQFSDVFAVETRSDIALNVVVVLMLLLASGGIVYAESIGGSGDGYTEFYLLATDENGELTAESYPTELQSGENTTYVVGIDNHERGSVQYSVVSQLRRIDNEGNSVVVEEQGRLQTRLAPNETDLLEHSVSPNTSGSDLRVVYLLYRGSPPSNPTVDNAYRSLQLNVTVEDTSQRQ